MMRGKQHSAVCRSVLGLVLAAPLLVSAQLSTNFSFLNLNLAIPDGDLTGLADSHVISGISGTISSLQVSLNIAGTGDGAFNGDLYATLVNSSGGFAVLVNRLGRTGTSSFGYSDNGLDITLVDALPDVHLYRTSPYLLNGNGQLTGLWGTDGRNVNPLNVLDTDSQSATLSSFYGSPADGTWTLFVADASNGATMEL